MNNSMFFSTPGNEKRRDEYSFLFSGNGGVPAYSPGKDENLVGIIFEVDILLIIFFWDKLFTQHLVHGGLGSR